jgi:hypothetical protein
VFWAACFGCFVGEAGCLSKSSFLKKRTKKLLLLDGAEGTQIIAWGFGDLGNGRCYIADRFGRGALSGLGNLPKEG